MPARVPVSRAIWILGLVMSGLMLFCGCAPTIPKLELAPAPPVAVEHVPVTCTVQSSWRGDVKEYTLPDILRYAAIDTAGDYLSIIHYLDKNRMSFVVIATKGDSIRLSYKIPRDGSASIVDAPTGMTILQGTDTLLWFDVETGKLLRGLPGYYAVDCSTDQLLHWDKTADANTISLWDRSSGAMFWKKPWEVVTTPHFRVWREGDHLFSVADGLRNTSLSDGKQWGFKEKIWHKNHAAEIAGILLTSVAGALGGGGYYGNMPSANMIYGLFSNPLVADSVVYFASEEHLTCLSVNSGSKIWQRNLQGRPSTAVLLKFNDLGIMVETGTDIKDQSTRETKNPYVSAFSLASGEEVWHFVPNPILPIKQALVWEGACALVTDSNFYVIDHSGNMIMDRRLDRAFRPSRIIGRNGVLLLAGHKSLTAFETGSYRELWSAQTDSSMNGFLNPDLTSEGWYETVYGKRGSRNAEFKGDSARFWTAEENLTGKLILCAYDLHTGKKERSVTFDYDNAWINAHQLVLYNNKSKRVGLMSIESLFAGLAK